MTLIRAAACCEKLEGAITDNGSDVQYPENDFLRPAVELHGAGDAAG